jgi:ribosomal protein L11 methyltransferase
MDTIELAIWVADDLQEFLIAELLDLDFEGFEQEDDFIRAFIPTVRWNDVKREHVRLWLLAHAAEDTPIRERILEPRNWNRLWEETVRPVAVAPFLIKPTWASVPPEHEGLIVLEIDPKMSFGTGYHESTRLVLRLLPGLVSAGDRVLDAGTGTGVLAIAALKSGAASAVAFDIDEWAQENAVENFYLNGVAERTVFRAGSIDVVPEVDFDLILANINRNVLIDLMPAFMAKLRPGGILVISGVLKTDREIMLGSTRGHRMKLVEETTENDWWGAAFAEQLHDTRRAAKW